MTLTFAPQTAFVFMLIFARLGSMVMTMPALGEFAVPSRIRLGMALAICFVMMPVVGENYTALPTSLAGMAFALFGEIAIGLLIGLSARLLTSALQVAGTVVAFQAGLAYAQNFDPTQGTQTAIVGTFLSLLAVTLIFTLDLHHLVLAAMRDSYALFAPGTALAFGDFARMAVMTVAGSFRVGVQIAAPFIVFGLIFNLGQGVLSRLMPQVQIFFVAMPAGILLGFVLLMLLTSSMMMWYLDYFSTGIGHFIR